METATFTESELAYMRVCPDVLRAVALYHENQQLLGEAMGYDCAGNERRQRELESLADAIDAETNA